MKKSLIAFCIILFFGNTVFAAERSAELSIRPNEPRLGDNVILECTALGDWQPSLASARIVIRNPENKILVSRENMELDGRTASYSFFIPPDESTGWWRFECIIRDGSGRLRQGKRFKVTEPETAPGDGYAQGPVAAHNTIVNYDGPSTCINCHEKEAADMLDSLHMKWAGPTPDVINSEGEELGKAVGGINTFCTYAMSSKGACFSCHLRADGNAPHPPGVQDVDCLMCHNEVYQRKFVADTENTETVVNILGEVKTYLFGKVDNEGNYITVPDFDKMPSGTNMVNLARTVDLPTTRSCLKCHAKAGGGDWTKRGDMGLNTAQATPDQDVHMSADGVDLTCYDCHSAPGHKIGGRGIDLRITEAGETACMDCHTDHPHSSEGLNLHSQGQVSCQVCHIRKFGKGGATEMSRDWRTPVWNSAFCSGQGGFVGHEVKESNVSPEYVWFDGTSYVYNVGETIEPDEKGIYHMAKANGSPFDGISTIVPIKRHATVMPLHESGKMIPPAIMWMFMTGDFDIAVQKGMEDQGMTGSYSIVEADAEMLITHGVEPKEYAPDCAECHNFSGSTPDGSGIVPFGSLGYHELPDAVKSCSLCHEPKSLQWEALHREHRRDNVACSSCHTSEPAGFVQAQRQLCGSCHEVKTWKNEGHKKHLEKGLDCKACHSFN